jgi:hypothetical protein
MPQIARDPTTVCSPPLVEHSFNTYTRRLPISFSLFQLDVSKWIFHQNIIFLELQIIQQNLILLP